MVRKSWSCSEVLWCAHWAAVLTSHTMQASHHELRIQLIYQMHALSPNHRDFSRLVGRSSTHVCLQSTEEIKWVVWESGSAPSGWTRSMSHLFLCKPAAHRGPAHALPKAQLLALLTVSPGIGSSWRHRSGLCTQKSRARLDSDSGEREVVLTALKYCVVSLVSWETYTVCGDT